MSKEELEELEKENARKECLAELLTLIFGDKRKEKGENETIKRY